MASTHTTGTLQAAATSLTTGSTQTSSSYDNTLKYGAIITAKVTTVTAGASPGTSVTLNVSPDNTNWYFCSQQTSGFAASTVYPFFFQVPPECNYAQVVWTNTSGQTVTVEAQYQALATI